MDNDSAAPGTGGRAPVDPGRMILLGHDLRAAVSDIIGGLRLIDHDGLDGDARLQLERVRASGEILARLLEEGLSMLLGEDDFVATHSAPLHLDQFLYDIEMRWSGRARGKGLGFSLTRSRNLPKTLATDRVALERVLANLLSNAIKYTDTGMVTLDVRISESGALVLAVTDQGPGFSADALTRLFEYQGRPDSTRKPGQGLGMHITRDMTGRLGGSISVENLAGRGARVSLELPAELWAAPSPQESAELPDLGGLSILLAEDSPTNQTIIGNLLSRMGARCVLAEDGMAAVERLEEERFDLALIDIEMPRLNGIEVLRRLRMGGGPNRDVPVVAITAYVLRANRDAIRAAGADAILAKPIAGAETFGKVIAKAAARTRSASAPPAAPTELHTVLDRESFDHLLDVAGPDSAAELLDRLNSDLRRTERGLIAGLSQSDEASIRAETHVLIALAGAVGAVRLQHLAQTLNAAAHRGAMGEIASLGQEALSQLDQLIHFVSQEQSRSGTAP